MSVTCPYCQQTDLKDGALKCHHCGSWVDPEKRSDEFEAFRRATRSEMSVDLATHRAMLENALARLKTFATAIIVVAGAVTVYFGFSTDQSVRAVGDDIAEQAELKLANVEENALNKAVARIDATLSAPEFQQQVRERIQGSVDAAVETEVAARTDEIGAAVDERFAAVQSDVDTAVAQATDLASAVVAKLDEVTVLQTQTEAVVEGVEVIQASFTQARDSRVEDTADRFEFESVEFWPKGGLDQLPVLMERRINTLTFVLGGSYVPQISWKYLDHLTRLSEFQYVVLLGENLRPVGYWDARELAAALNPPDNFVLSATHSADLQSVPDPDRLPEWIAFTDMLLGVDPGPLTGLAGFTGMDRSVSTTSSNLDALRVMAEVKQDSLPVLTDGGDLAGFVDRSRLTTKMLLEIATEQQ